jgi:hypothetical protein
MHMRNIGINKLGKYNEANKISERFNLIWMCRFLQDIKLKKTIGLTSYLVEGFLDRWVDE